MSLPNYLARIKSSGVYRFVWDKSQLPPAQAETMRLLVGYSEKGPFNAPVYIDSVPEFKRVFGNMSKRLEHKGSYFHRSAIQALSAGPILALNLKPFNEEKIDSISFVPKNIKSTITPNQFLVKNIYNRKRFWSLDIDNLPKNVNGTSQYISIAATDTLETSCTIVYRKSTPETIKQYGELSIVDWYRQLGEEMPEYLESIKNKKVKDYIMDIYVFKGDLKTAAEAENSLIAKYFNISSSDLAPASVNTKDGKQGENIPSPRKTTLTTIKATIEVNNVEVDTLEIMKEDSNTGFISSYTGCVIPYFKDLNGRYISIDLLFNADYSIHKMIMKLNEEHLNNSTIANINMPVTPTTEYNICYLKGYTYETPENNLENCLNILTESDYAGIREALTNRVDVDYHYIVDTFDTNIGDHKKKILASIAKEKQNAFAILNFPKMSLFKGITKKSTDSDGDYADKFSMPGETEGAAYCAFYTQLVFSDGTVKSVVPSAALVSNNFMDKWGARQPYYIVAGPNYGVLSYSGLIGPDFNFGRKDLDVLEPKGINAIIYVPRRGTYINSNQTAKQIPVSALSKVHITELVIYLQDEIERLLQSYQWELNTQPLRDTIKAKADVICDTIKNNGGIYVYRNICDETNNTPEVIDNEMIILDTEIEPARGAGKMVHRLTIHKTGGMSVSVN